MDDAQELHNKKVIPFDFQVVGIATQISDDFKDVDDSISNRSYNGRK